MISYLRRFSLALVLVVVLSGLVCSYPGRAAARQHSPTFVAVDCAAWNLYGAIECGHVVVPEKWDDPDSPTIRLAVVIFRASDVEPDAAVPDPVFYLFGGPGTEALRWASSIAANFPRDRDLVLFDQRGVGRSQPNLNCHEVDDLYYATLDQRYNAPGTAATWYAAIESCRDRLLDQGIDVAAYTTVESAADVNAIRIALGYDQINLYGVSYGTFLAQYVMRQYPETIRASMLDGVLPVDAKVVEADPANSRRALTRLFDRCAQDSVCSTSYPDLETEFLALVDRLNADPLRLRKSDPFTGHIYTVMVDGDRLIEQTFIALGSPSSMMQFPAAIRDLTEGKSNRFHALLSIGWPVLTSEGMMLSTLCTDIVPHNDLAVMDAAIAAFDQPAIRAFYMNQLPLASLATYPYDCEHWIDAPVSPAAHDPVVSSIPTLILSGEFDDVTPPAWGDQVASHLAHSHAFVIPGQGHVVIGQDCANRLLAAFLADPFTAPDASCLENVPNLRFK